MASLDNVITLMGWNQLILITWSADCISSFDLNTDNVIGGEQLFRTDSYDIGVLQTGEGPDYVTGIGDRTAWKRGPIISQGSLNFPFTFGGGLNMFRAGALLSANPTASFQIESSVNPLLINAKVNTTQISCEAEQDVQATAEVWGIVDDDRITEVSSAPDIPGRRPYSSAYAFLASGEPNTGDPTGSSAGLDRIVLEEIPMFDAVSVEGAPPGMFIVGFTLNVDNRLKRNYTMGTGVVGATDQYSPYGLNATSISANQRMITGSIRWQSDADGYISQIIGTGLSECIIRIGTQEIKMNNILWNAQPPTLSAGDRVVIESSFTAFGSGTTANQPNGLDALYFA